MERVRALPPQNRAAIAQAMGRHILIPIHDFSAGGTEIIAFRLAAHWLAAGWAVTVLAGAADGPMRERVPAGANVQVITPPVPRSTASRLRLGRAMAPFAAALAPDVVFIPGNFHFVLAHALKRAMPHVPIAGKISNPLLPDHPLVRGAASIGGRLLHRYLAPIDMTVAMSRGLEADQRRLNPAGAVCTILDPNIPDEATPPPMRDRRGATGPVRLLAIGRLEPQKDMARAIDTLAALRGQTDAVLTILGEGYLRSRLEAQIGRLGLTGAVRMPGFVDDIAAAFDHSDLLLVTSRYEGGPATAVEALARAVPVVSTDCSHFLRDVITDPRLGRLVAGTDPAALADAVRAQMATEPADAGLVLKAIGASRYSASADAYLALFERLCASRSA